LEQAPREKYVNRAAEIIKSVFFAKILVSVT
jgi:hypothetical protein